MSLCMNQLLVAVLSFLFVTSALFYDTVLGITNCSVSFLSCLSKFKIDYSMLDLLSSCHGFFFTFLCFCEGKKKVVDICLSNFTKIPLNFFSVVAKTISFAVYLKMLLT